MNKHSERILVIEDDDAFARQLIESLEGEGYQTLRAHEGSEALRFLEKGGIDLGFVDLAMPGVDGMKVLETALEIAPHVPLVMITGFASIDKAVKAIQYGAYDFIEKPVNLDRLLITARRALERRQLEIKTRWMSEDILSRYKMVGTSKPMQKVYNIIDKVAPVDTTILITGETGTGKELVAVSLHMRSKRVDGPYVRVNCAAIPDTLIESELFGHKRGAFTDANADKDGKFIDAHGGTIFLDEVGDMSSSAQAKVLRVLQEHELERLGDNKKYKVDVRVIAATNKNLTSLMKDNLFREDLYYRVNGIEIYIPPLRERKEDIPALVEHFIELQSTRHNRKVHSISPGGMQCLIQYDWPGNVRELQSVIEHLVIFTEGNRITTAEAAGKLKQNPAQTYAELPYSEAMKSIERDYLINALLAHDWHVTETAKALDICRTNLYKKMKNLGIEKPAK